ncbi:chaperone modulator CbpM [Paludibacterium yongneupense]|uniref:chaperone modulator CbpM n=1 Tax=Paludibacterium yongneupense TaxID=400061 RepID=UPI00048E8972|nr:chaperone modulator CbpM [Paludibacterium yongneupense]
MTSSRMTLLVGVVVEEDVGLSLSELARASGADESQLVEWVLEGVLDPSGGAPADWRFGGASLRRAHLARRLSEDLEINPPGVALALDLIDEIDSLRSHLRRRGAG